MRWIGATLALLLPGCAGAPGADVPDSTMVAALVDLHLLDARRETFGDSTARGQRLDVDSLRAATLAVHGLDTAAFNAALSGLAAEPARIRTVYDSVIVRLNAANIALRQRD